MPPSDEPQEVEAPADTAVVKSGRDISSVEYNSANPYPNHGNTLADVLRKRKIASKRIDRLEFVGDESSRTSGLIYVERDRDMIDLIWSNMLETAEPYKFWLPSGNRTVKIFVRGRKTPAAVLSVNETDSTAVDGARLTYMCHGLHRLAVDNLEKAKQETGAAPPNFELQQTKAP